MHETNETLNADDRSAEEMLKRVKGRNLAIALSLAVFVVLIFTITVVRLGPDVLSRPL